MPNSIIWKGSCNKTTGRAGYRPEAVVIHIMDDDIHTVDDWFNTPKGPKNTMPVSAHYGISRGGAVHQYVREMDTAWHAGRVHQCAWPGLRPNVSPNLYTIGIEHEGKPHMPWTDAMYEASGTLLAGISQRWSIPLDRQHVIRHGEIYGKKSYCPGPNCDLEHLIDIATSVLLSGAEVNHVPTGGVVTAISNINVRRGAPSSMSELVRTVPKGTELKFSGWTSTGETVHGNAHWYVDAQGNYFWAGATSGPLPGT